MTSTITRVTTATADGREAVQVKGPEGTVVAFVPGEDDAAARSAARSVACKVAKTVAVGRTPIGQAAKLGDVAGHTFRFSPVSSSKGEATAAVLDAPKAPAVPAGDPLVAALVKLGLPLDEARRIVGQQLGIDAPAKPAKSTKAERPAPEFVTRRRDALCKACADLGVVRGVGKNAGKPYRTANGATAATANGRSVPCPSHVTGKGKGGKGKAATA